MVEEGKKYFGGMSDMFWCFSSVCRSRNVSMADPTFDKILVRARFHFSSAMFRKHVQYNIRVRTRPLDHRFRR